jgi:hypothetical protein
MPHKLKMLGALCALAVACGPQESTEVDVGTTASALVSAPTLNVSVGFGVLASANEQTFWKGASLSWQAPPECSAGCTYYLRESYNGVATDSVLVPDPSPFPRTYKTAQHLFPAIRGSSQVSVQMYACTATECSPLSNRFRLRRCGGLEANEYLYADEPIYACQGGTGDDASPYRLYPQADGNLVLSQKVNGSYSQLVWQTRAKAGANRLYMQGDGNLVWSAQPQNTVKWTSGTSHTNGAYLWLTTTGEMQIKLGQTVVWSVP